MQRLLSRRLDALCALAVFVRCSILQNALDNLRGVNILVCMRADLDEDTQRLGVGVRVCLARQEGRWAMIDGFGQAAGEAL